jgi:hypothetical protein
MAWTDPITYESYSSEENVDAFLIGMHKYHKSTMQTLIYTADLGINIENADEDEFVISALQDRLYANAESNDANAEHANPLRFRNPTTNLAFTEPELRYIWRQYFNLFMK